LPRAPLRTSFSLSDMKRPSLFFAMSSTAFS
jgi:hypothetical protein